jgi:TM2 domain-containing membrane protein YozV
MRSDRYYGVAVVLVVLFGYIGAHRFYAGRNITAVVQAITLGGFGVWWVIDILVVSLGQFRDVSDRYIRWRPRPTASQP